MQSSVHVDLTDLSREEKLQIWMRRNRISFRQLALFIGISHGATCKLCSGETMPVRRHAQCLEFGIPSALLPEPLDITPGPKPKSSGQNCMA